MNGIKELSMQLLGGYKQAVLIRGENKDAPLLVFFHGGPGSAMIGMAASVQKKWEKHFIVVNWDQLGSGMSYDNGIHPEDMTVCHMLKCADELVDWLLKRFGRQQIFLAGHSWGSMLALLYASQHPEKVAKYVSISQVIDFNENERACYDLCVKKATETGNKKALEELTGIGKPPYAEWEKGILTRCKWAGKFKTTILKGDLSFISLRKMIFGREYNLKAIKKWMAGSSFSMHTLLPDIIKQDLYAQVKALDMPVLFCLGRYDGNTPSDLTAEYCECLEAPEKKVVWFENSAHMCFLEEPEIFYRTTIDFLLS